MAKRKRLLTAKDIRRRLPEYVVLMLIRQAFSVSQPSTAANL